MIFDSNIKHDYTFWGEVHNFTAKKKISIPNILHQGNFNKRKPRKELVDKQLVPFHNISLSFFFFFLDVEQFCRCLCCS